MEGIRPTPRKPKTAATQKKSVKEKQNPKSRSKTKPEENLKREIPEEMVGEPGQAIPSLYEQAPAEQSTRIKHEPLEISNQGNAGDMEWMSLEPYSCPEKSLIDPKLEDADLTPTSAFQAIKEEPRVKMEPIWNWRKDTIIGHQLEKLCIFEWISKDLHVFP